MHEALFFVIGLLLGSLIGIMVMCLFQIHRHDGKEDESE